MLTWESHMAPGAARGDFDGAILYYQKGIEADPVVEGLYRLLMQCYYRANRPNEALSVYRRCQAILASVLHVEPSAQIRALHDEIRAKTIEYNHMTTKRGYR